MIRNFETPPQTEPDDRGRFQWIPAVEAGLIAGGILMVVPQGSPWSSLDFFAPVVMGRVIPESWSVPLMVCFIGHLGLSVLYSLIISRAVTGGAQLGAVITGGIMGLFLYTVNFALVSVWYPELRVNEVPVAF